MKLHIVVAAILTVGLAAVVAAQDKKATTTEKMKSAATPAEVQSQQQKLKELAPEFQKLLKGKGLSPEGMECHTVCTARVIIGPDGKPQTVLECSLVCS